MLESNRLSRAIADYQTRIDGLDEAGRSKLDADMDVDFEEHFRYQELKSQWQLQGWLTLDEAQLIYVALGEVGSSNNGGWAAGTDLATKVVVTLAIGELLGRRVSR